MCCRAYGGYPTNQSEAAREYGEYGCDLPTQTFELMLEYVRDEIKPDVVFWTGDVPPHDMWNYNTEYVQTYQQNLTDYMKEYFSEFSVYPLEGNHDFGTANCQDFNEKDPMIDFNLEQWQCYLDEQAQKTYEKAGYYSQTLTLSNGTNYQKVRVIAVTTQPMYQFNFYLWSTREDPGDELQWLSDLLHQME